MRIAAVGLFLVTFAVTLWAIGAVEPTDPPGPVAVAARAETEPIRSDQAETARTVPTAKSEKRAAPRVAVLDGLMGAGFRVDASDNFSATARPGTKVDVFLLPRGQDSAGPPERVASGVFVAPTSTINMVDEKTGEVLRETYVNVCLAVTREQCERLAAAEQRGTLRLVPAE